MHENKTPPPHGGKCPYWALEGNKECGMVKGGMYIPMPEHVRTFCLSSLHARCPKYIKGCEHLTNHDNCERCEQDVNGDRRKMRRFVDQLFLKLIVCDKTVTPRAINDCKAKTLDLSIGGMRMESPRELNTDTIVCFESDPDFSPDNLVGVGEVKWCEPKEDSDMFEFGIAFSDYSTSKGMREYLGYI